MKTETSHMQLNQTTKDQIGGLNDQNTLHISYVSLVII